MTRIRQQLFILLLSLAGTSGMFAQQTITLKEAIQYGLKNKADAIKAKLEVQNADYLIAESKAGALPHINASGALTYNPILQKTPLPGDFFGQPGAIIMVPFGQKWSSHLGAQLQQALFNQQVFVGLKAAKTTKEFYQINKQLTDEKLIENIATAYYQVFSTKQQLEAVDSSYASTKKVRDIIKSLFDNGLAKEVDLDRTNVNLTNLETTQSKLRNAVTQSENALKFYIGMPINTPIQLAAADLQVNPPLLESGVDTSQRTELQALDKQKKLLEYNVQATKAAYYPSLSLVGNYTWQGTGDQFPIGAGQKKGVYWTDFASVGIQLNIPIFNGFEIKAKVDQSKIKLESLVADINDTKLGMDLEYENAKVQIENSLEAIRNQEANRELAETVVRNTRSNYQYGLASLTDLLDAETSLVQAKNNYTNAILDFKIAEVQLYKSKGKLENLIQ